MLTKAVKNAVLLHDPLSSNYGQKALLTMQHTTK